MQLERRSREQPPRSVAGSRCIPASQGRRGGGHKAAWAATSTAGDRAAEGGYGPVSGARRGRAAALRSPNAHVRKWLRSSQRKREVGAACGSREPALPPGARAAPAPGRAPRRQPRSHGLPQLPAGAHQLPCLEQGPDPDRAVPQQPRGARVPQGGRQVEQGARAQGAQRAGDRHRLGPREQPAGDVRHRPQRLRVDAQGQRVEAHAGHPAHQPRRPLRQVVPQGEQVRRGQRLPPHLHLLLRAGERLVGLQAHQEAHPLHGAEPRLAPQQRPAGRRLLRLQVPDLLRVHQGGGGAAQPHGLGLQDALRGAALRGGRRLRLGAQHQLLGQRRPCGLGEPRQHRVRGGRRAQDGRRLPVHREPSPAGRHLHHREQPGGRGPRLLPHALHLRGGPGRADLRREAGRAQAELPARPHRPRALPEPGQEGELGHGQRGARHAAQEQHQPDLGAGGREGQVLTVLHHGHGRRHEHLGRQEPGGRPEGSQDQVKPVDRAARPGAAGLPLPGGSRCFLPARPRALSPCRRQRGRLPAPGATPRQRQRMGFLTIFVTDAPDAGHTLLIETKNKRIFPHVNPFFNLFVYWGRGGDSLV